MALKTIDITRTTTPRPRPDESQLGFGKYFADHMLLVEYGPQGWSEPRIAPYGPLALDPAASVLHYGQAMFEGLKAFRHADGRVALFRVEDNLKRLASGAPQPALSAARA
jgi:branched-chain amino acid aminotransferase